MRDHQRAGTRRWAARAALAVALAAGAVLASSPSVAQDRGFLLLGTDAAYATFIAEDVPGGVGYCNVQIGYVRANALIYFDGEVVRPHSDLEVKFEDCGALTGSVGVVGTVGHPDASVTRLDSASIDGIDVPIELADPTVADRVTASVDVDWTAHGRRYTQRFRDEHGGSLHRTRAADVTGSVVFEVVDNGTTWTYTFTEDDVLVLDPPEIWPQITRYNEIYIP